VSDNAPAAGREYRGRTGKKKTEKQFEKSFISGEAKKQF
jgi:hypothetical protein